MDESLKNRIDEILFPKLLYDISEMQDKALLEAMSMTEFTRRQISQIFYSRDFFFWKDIVL